MKGGVLMDLIYNTTRFTTDLDFSTTRHFRDFQPDLNQFIESLGQALQMAENRLNYGVRSKVQSYKVEPSDEGNYQTLRIKIAYATAGNSNAMRRLQAGTASDVVGIDYSFNELIGEIDLLALDDTHQVRVYGEVTLIAEKLRAILQQEVRSTTRRQDVYDIHFVLTHRGFPDAKKEALLNELIRKANSRGLSITSSSMRSDRVYQ